MLRLKKRSLPLNMRQSGDVDAKIKITTRLRKGPYWHLAVKAGAWLLRRITTRITLGRT